MKNTRQVLKTYFETGDYPTEAQFAELIDSFVHLDEFNFGIDVKMKGGYMKNKYHFYVSKDVQLSGVGHKTELATSDTAPSITNYNHVLTREVLYKQMEVSIVGGINIEKHKPRIIVERYKQKKKLRSGYIKPAGYYKEEMTDAQQWNRKSEYDFSSTKMDLDLNPINYFKPNSIYSDFSPSGSKSKNSSNRKYKFKHGKPFVPIRLKLEISIDGVSYQSRPVELKIVLGSAGETDCINYLFD